MFALLVESHSPAAFLDTIHEGAFTEYDFFLLLSISTTFYQVGLPVPLSMQFMDPATSADKISRGSHPVFILTIQDNAVFSTLGLMPPQYVSYHKILDFCLDIPIFAG